MADLVRQDQTRKMLALVHEAREIGPGLEQDRHLASGLHQIFHAAMTTVGVLIDLSDPFRRRAEREVSTPSSSNVRTLINAVCRNRHVSRGLDVMSQLVQSQPMVTARRCELMSDEEWYRSESFNQLHRPCGFDDHVHSFRSLGGGRTMCISVRRALGDRPFTEEERNLLELFHEEVARLPPLPLSEGPRLTPREREVLQQLLHGASEKEVAFELHLSPHTVHTHTKSIYAAYGVASRAELLARCLGGRS